MTLNFDLTEAQQKDIYKLNLKEANERKQMMEARKGGVKKRITILHNGPASPFRVTDEVSICDKSILSDHTSKGRIYHVIA